MLKDKWIAALRSGKYKQGKGALQRNESFCCLGVLCEVAGVHNFDHDGFGMTYEFSDGMKSKSNISAHSVLYPLVEGIEEKLICMNDNLD